MLLGYGSIKRLAFHDPQPALRQLRVPNTGNMGRVGQQCHGRKEQGRLGGCTHGR